MNRRAQEQFNRLHSIASEIKRRSRGRLSDPDAWHQAEQQLRKKPTTPDLFQEADR